MGRHSIPARPKAPTTRLLRLRRHRRTSLMALLLAAAAATFSIVALQLNQSVAPPLNQSLALTSSASLTLTPLADAVANQLFPARAAGSSSVFVVDAVPGRSRISYLRFRLPPAPPGASAPQVTLSMFTEGASSIGWRVHSVANDSWSEATLNWQNAPAFARVRIGISGPVSRNQWTEAALKSSPGWGSDVDYALTTRGSYLPMSSREGVHPPRLEVRYTIGSSVPTPGPTTSPLPSATPTPRHTPIPIQSPTPRPTPTRTTTPQPTPTPRPRSNYDAAVLADRPDLFLAMDEFSSGSESDLSGHEINGRYQGGTPGSATLPNGDLAADFNGSSQFLTVPSSASLSIPTTDELTWEAWIRPDTLQFPHSTGGYVDWMGKCANYSPTCEWEARIYNATNPQNRYDRMSAYVFNNTAGLGSGADWQPNQNELQAGQWLYVVGEYQTLTTASGCSGPGSINIWVNGVKWDAAAHHPTGCLSQFGVSPTAGNSPLNIGTMARDSWFEGAIGKVAIYNYLLSPAQIAAHYQAMTGAQPSGSCANTCTIPAPTP
jgi:Concanavalin A-like lectin/glucanases superfamily